MIDSYLTYETQRLLQLMAKARRHQQPVSQKLSRLHAVRAANMYSAEEVLTAQ
jgi:hypothetical protein